MTAIADSVKTHCLSPTNIRATAIPNAARADIAPRAVIHLGGGASESSSLHHHVLTAVITKTRPATNKSVEGIRSNTSSPLADAIVPKRRPNSANCNVRTAMTPAANAVAVATPRLPRNKIRATISQAGHPMQAPKTNGNKLAITVSMRDLPSYLEVIVGFSPFFPSRLAEFQGCPLVSIARI